MKLVSGGAAFWAVVIALGGIESGVRAASLDLRWSPLNPRARIDHHRRQHQGVAETARAAAEPTPIAAAPVVRRACKPRPQVPVSAVGPAGNAPAAAQAQLADPGDEDAAGAQPAGDVSPSSSVPSPWDIYSASVMSYVSSSTASGWDAGATASSTRKSKHKGTSTTSGAAGPSATSSPPDHSNGTSGSGTGGFPFSGTFSSRSPPNAVPSVPVSSWWSSSLYGFLGFSMPLEQGCVPSSDLTREFKAMKDDFGAVMVRAYAPSCRDASLWRGLIDAAVANDMAVVFQIWWGFEGQEAWRGAVDSLLQVLNSPDYGPIAPYVVQSIEFGSEPIGDGVEGGPDGFVAALKTFRGQVAQFGIPVGISEDWDRPGVMSAGDRNGLAGTGQQVRDNSDVIHAHVMPYYHGRNSQSAWSYVADQLAWYSTTLSSLPVIISESQWAAGSDTPHGGGEGDVGPTQYATYWSAFDDHCEAFRDARIGWMIHAWQGEGEFDMAPNGGGGSYRMQGFRPRRC